MTFRRPTVFRSLFALAAALTLTACAPEPEPIEPAPVEVIVQGYEAIIDNGYGLPAVPSHFLEEPNRRVLVYYTGEEEPGTIEVDRYAKFLYWILDDGTAWRYPIAVGRLGKTISSDTVIRRKEEWPGWTPTANMIRREPEIYGDFAGGIPGGLRSPLGARALYLFRGGRDTYYRIHGTNDLGSIGNSGSAGCIRMFNHDIIHLFDMVPNGTKVVMRSEEDSQRIEEEYYGRGVELEALQIDPEDIYGAEALAADRPLAEILADHLTGETAETETEADTQG